MIYNDGPFATCADDAAHPELWEHCVGAWAPFVGCGGAILFDRSGMGNHGTLTNFTLNTAWPVSDGHRSILADGTNDYVTFGTALSGINANFTATMWIRSTALALNDCLFGTFNSTTGGVGWAFRCNGTDDIGISTGSSSGFTNDTYSPVTNTNDGLWHFCAFVCDVGGTSGTMYYSAREGAIPVADPVNFGGHGITASTLNLVLGGSSVGPGGSFLANANFDCLTIHRVALPVASIYKLASCRGIMYEPRRLVRLYTQQAGFNPAWASGSNVLLGAGGTL